MMRHTLTLCGLLATLISAAWASPLWMDTFPSYPGATSLCEQHITGSTGHILWHAYTSTDDPAKVRAYYAKRLKPEKNEPAELTVRAGDHLLSVYPAASTAYPSCGQAPPAGARTVIVVSQMIRAK